MTDDENKYLQELFPIEATKTEIIKKYRSYIASPFIAAALPLKDVKKNVFERKYNNINFKLTSDIKVPYGKNGRLLLTIMTTHAVLDKDANPDSPVVIQYTSLQQLLDELQLPKQRGKEIKEQLECFSGASFVFREKKTQKVQKYLFKEFFKEEEKLSGEINATWHTSGVVPFFESLSYVDIDENGKEKKSIGLTIVLSEKFTRLSKEHSVPIDYGVYKEISSVVGKDLYAWFVYRNNSIDEPIFISRESLINQFLPVKEKSYESEERVNWNTLKEQITLIKKKYYPDLNVTIAQDNSGITLAKSKPVILPNDKHYVLVTANL
ncbi:replication protein RepA [uncultured Treponema sp.]|uniref:replication protein RepA n=1 Tax=uncultured Treponema sp. TaxID=162155 RepID=UPI0025E52205|nr:replication protein RepA [uncultured Treponema sp.]